MSILTTRKSIRNYDENFKIERSELEEILKIASRAPSSQNLQPTRVVVIESIEGKNKVRNTLYGNESQLDTSSAFMVLFTDTLKYEMTEKIFSQSVNLGLMPKEVMNRQLSMFDEVKGKLTLDQITKTGILDAGLFGMQLMLTAKEFGYDTCPIGGFNKSTINEAIGIDSRYVPVLIISIGKAAEDGYESLRLPLEEIVTYM